MQLFRRWLSWILIALLAAAPLMTVAAKAQRGTLLQEICAPSGAKQIIALDLSQAPNGTAAHDPQDCCAACGSFGLALPSPVWPPLSATQSSQTIPLPGVFASALARQWQPAAPRGP